MFLGILKENLTENRLNNITKILKKINIEYRMYKLFARVMFLRVSKSWLFSQDI